MRRASCSSSTRFLNRRPFELGIRTARSRRRAVGVAAQSERRRQLDRVRDVDEFRLRAS